MNCSLRQQRLNKRHFQSCQHYLPSLLPNQTAIEKAMIFSLGVKEQGAAIALHKQLVQ